MESRSPEKFSGHMSPYDMKPRKPHEDSTSPPIWLSGLIDSMKLIENKVNKNTTEVENIKKESSKK
jgi:hypothetical protein